MLFSNKGIKEERLTKENILKYITEYDVYNYYLPNIQVGETTNSPFRKDLKPSFGIFIGNSGELAFNDYKLGGGDFIKFVSYMENCNYRTAMSIINKTFDIRLVDPLSNEFTHIESNGKRVKVKIPKKKHPKISISVRDWKKHDKEYWHPVTKLRGILPIDIFWIDEQRILADKYAYAYRYDKNIYKIYQPMKEVASGKFYSNISTNVDWFGHKYLPDKGDLLIVASSNKDKLVLDNIGFNSIAPHTESQMFSVKQYKEYSKRFEKIVIFYDNDETGILKSERFSEAYNLDYIVLEEEDTKDPFEFVKKYDLETLKDWIEQWI